MNIVKLIKEIVQIPKEVFNYSGTVGKKKTYNEYEDSYERLSMLGGVVFGGLLLTGITVPFLMLIGVI